jgi:hypothetical protein
MAKTALDTTTLFVLRVAEAFVEHLHGEMPELPKIALARPSMVISGSEQAFGQAQIEVRYDFNGNGWLVMQFTVQLGQEALDCAYWAESGFVGGSPKRSWRGTAVEGDYSRPELTVSLPAQLAEVAS